MTTKDLIPTLIHTKNRETYFGWMAPGDDRTSSTITLTGARMAIYWGTTGGVDQLARTGPTSSSRIGDPVEEIVVREVTTIRRVSVKAAEKWTAYPIRGES